MKIHVVTEGKLEVPVAKRLLDFCGHSRGTFYTVRGFGNIEKKTADYACLADDATAVLVLTDFMDSKSPCPIAARKRYLEKCTSVIHPNFLLRFAVNELESWLLADHRNFARLLGVRANKIASQPDMLPDPKRHIAELARLSRQEAIKKDLISVTGRQGKRYLPIMEKFVNEDWDIGAAMRRSPSLNRCVARLRSLNAVQ